MAIFIFVTGTSLARNMISSSFLVGCICHPRDICFSVHFLNILQVENTKKIIFCFFCFFDLVQDMTWSFYIGFEILVYDPLLNFWFGCTYTRPLRRHIFQSGDGSSLGWLRCRVLQLYAFWLCFLGRSCCHCSCQNLWKVVQTPPSGTRSRQLDI